MRRPTREVFFECAGAVAHPPAAHVRKAVVSVLDGEDVGVASINVTFLSAQRMRALNRRTFGLDRATDVIAFGMPHPGRVVGDVYVCPSIARKNARRMKVSEGEEMVRLLVHGVLHALGRDHPLGEGRTSSPMWCAQERYVREAMKVGA